MKKIKLFTLFLRLTSLMRKITFLFSVVLHIAFIYVLFNAQFQLTIIKLPEEITTVSLISTEEKSLSISKTPSKVGQKLIFTEPSPGRPGSLPGSRGPGREKAMEKRTAGFPFKFKANFSFSHGQKQPSLLKHKPDFLLSPGTPKDYYFVDPNSKIKPESHRDFFKYLYPHRYSYSDFSRVFHLEDSSSPGDGELGSIYSSRQKGVGIGINAGGFNIGPWARKAVIKVQENWQSPPGLKLTPKTSISVGVLVIIEKSGIISSSEIKKKSKEKFLDQSALTALNASVPFPELPAGFPLKNLEAYFLFTVKDE